MSANDNRIITLKETIEAKRIELQEEKRFIPQTTCCIQLKDGTKINLHTLDTNELSLALIIMQTLFNNAYALNMTDIKISGFYFNEWIDDISALLHNKQVKEKKAQLNQLEKKLDSLLSEDKRTELELDDIANLLK